MRRSVRFSSLLFLALIATIPLRAEEPEGLPPPGPPSVPDAAQFFTLDEVTVVYPAGPGEDVERNRLSARMRARYLETIRKIRAKEVADDQLTEAEKGGHLLVLGWRNRLLASLEADRRPFARSERGFRFLGLDHVGADDDLLFFCHSPFAKDRFLLFWSRIDPERDRLQLLPFVGSNWAVYRDLSILRQGMFEGGIAWPPVRNELAETDRTERFAELDAARLARSSAHYDLSYSGTGDPEEAVRAILTAREAAYAKAVAAIGAPPADFRIRLFVYPDARAKKERTGVEDAAHSLPWRRELHLLERLARNPAAHEEVHLVARAVLGASTLTSLYEGLAIYEDGTVSGTELDVHAALLLDRGAMPALDDLLEEHRTRALPEGAAVPSYGLLVGWLRSLGAGALTRAYLLPGGGAEALAKALGRPRAKLEESFRAWLRERAKPRRGDVEFVREEAAAQERYRAGDYEGVAAALTRALRAKPDDPQTLFNLASAQVRIGGYAAAEKNLRKILELPVAKKDSHLPIFARYQLGRLYDVQGLRKSALEEYRKVLAMPDRHDAHRLAREAIETPVTKDHLD